MNGLQKAMIVTKRKIATSIMLIGFAFSGICATAFSSMTAGQTAPNPPSPPQNPTGDGRTKQEQLHETVDKNDDKMFPDGRDHDFGKVPTGTLCKHVFRIVNTSDTPIHIASVRFSACTQPAQARYVGHVNLQPKEAGRLEITVDTRLFHGVRGGRGFLGVETNKGNEEFAFSSKADSVPSQER